MKFKVIDTRTGEDVTINGYFSVNNLGTLFRFNGELIYAEDHYKVIFDKPKVKQLEWKQNGNQWLSEGYEIAQTDGYYSLWIKEQYQGCFDELEQAQRLAQDYHDNWVLNMLEGE